MAFDHGRDVVRQCLFFTWADVPVARSEAGFISREENDQPVQDPSVQDLPPSTIHRERVTGNGATNAPVRLGGPKKALLIGGFRAG